MSKRKKAMVSVEQGTISNGKKKRTVTFDEENIDATVSLYMSYYANGIILINSYGIK